MARDGCPMPRSAAGIVAQGVVGASLQQESGKFLTKLGV